MLNSLIKNELYAYVNWFTGGKANTRKGKKRSTASMLLYAFLMIYLLGIFGWLFFQIFDAMFQPLHMLGFDWLFFIYVFVVAFALMFIFSVFTAKSKLYEAKDNDLLLSLPIRPGVILASRLISLWLLGFLFEIVVAVPGALVWFSGSAPTVPQIVSYVLICLCLPFFSLSISSLFGWLLALAASRMRKKTLFETVVSLLFLGAYIYFYSQMNVYIQRILANSEAIAAAMEGISPLYWIGSCVGNENMLHLLFSILTLLLPFVLVYYILSSTFIKTATAQRGAAKIKYEDKGQKVSSVSAALLKRESGRFFSSSTYVINAGLGSIFSLIGAVALLIFKTDLLDITNMLLAMMPALKPLLVPIFILMIGFMAGMSMPTSASVSLEGQSLWIIQSLPVPAADALKAKLKLSLLLYIPTTLLCILAVIYVFTPEVIPAALSVALCLIITYLMAELGLAVNLRHPMLDWTAETQPIKSGSAVLLAMLVNFGIVVTMGLGGYFLFRADVSVTVILGIFLIVFAILALLIRSWLMKRGTKIFESL